MNQNEIVAKDIERLRSESKLFARETIVLEKNENSSLVQKVLPCNTEFFDKLFNSIFWKIRSEFGLSKMPFDCKYLHFLNNEMFFCKNTEEHFIKKIGLEKKFYYSNGKILQKKPNIFEKIVFFAALPFALAKNAATVSVAASKINKELESFEEHYDNSLSFWKKNRVIDNAVLLSLQAMAGALQSMRYSFLSSLAYSLKIRLRQCFATERNLMKELALLSHAINDAELRDKAGFFSLSPYDISKPFLEENPFLVDFLKKMPAPTEPHYILRQNAKLCCSMYLSVLRKCFLKVAELKELSRDVFFLKPAELQTAFSDFSEAEKLCERRKSDFDKTKKIFLPPRIAITQSNFFFETEQAESEIQGISVGAKAIVEGRLVFAETARDLGKVVDGDIIFSKAFSPELVVFYGKCIGVLSQTGSELAHSAIVAREKGLPCIVQLKGSQLLKEGARISVDGNTGKLALL